MSSKLKNALKMFKLCENVFVETSVTSPKYDGVVLIKYPDEKKVGYPRDINSFVKKISCLDKNTKNVATLWICDKVSGGRLILAPTGKITPYHDAKVLYLAAKKGILRAIDAGMKKPLLVVQNLDDLPDSQLACVLGALECLYTSIQTRELKTDKTSPFEIIGFHAEEVFSEKFERIVKNATALEISRVVARDIAGGDPERMTPIKIVEYVKEQFADAKNVSIEVIDKPEDIANNYPLLAAVSRAASIIERHKPRVVRLVYVPTNPCNITETVMLVGKGVTYDTGGADIKINGSMAGMKCDKSGAAAVVGFLKACSVLKPQHLKVVGILCLCRNSIGEDCYVADEVLVSKSGKTVRVVNTDAEGRLAMADALFEVAKEAEKQINPQIYTIATLTGHARSCYGNNVAAMDNHCAKTSNHSAKLQLASAKIGEGIEESLMRPEDFDVNSGKSGNEDLMQMDSKTKYRGHQMAAGFLMRISGLDEKDVRYTHLDIAGAAGSYPDEPTAVPLLTLCHVHKVI